MQRKDVFVNLRWAVIIGTSYLIIAESNYNITLFSSLFLLAFINSNFVVYKLQKKYANNPYFYQTVALTDILVVSLAIYFFGKPSAEFYIIYFFIIMLSALGENMRLGLLVAAVASSLYIYYQVRAGEAGLDLPIKIGFLFVVAIFNTTLVANLRKEHARVRSLEKEKEKLHAVMEEEKEKLGEALQVVDAVMQILNEKKQIRWSNKEYEEGTSCLNIKSGICVKCAMDEADESRMFVKERLLGNKKKYFAVFCSPMHDHNYISITRDITKIKETELSLELKRTALSFMIRLSELANKAKTLDELFSQIASNLETSFGFEIVVLRALKGSQMIMIGSKGIEKSIMPEMHSVKLGETISGAAILMRKPIIVKDMDVFYASYSTLAKKLGLKCLISLPLYSRGALFGTLSMGSRSEKNIDQTHVNILNAAASCIGMSIAPSLDVEFPQQTINQ